MNRFQNLQQCSVFYDFKLISFSIYLTCLVQPGFLIAAKTIQLSKSIKLVVRKPTACPVLLDPSGVDDLPDSFDWFCYRLIGFFLRQHLHDSLHQKLITSDDTTLE